MENDNTVYRFYKYCIDKDNKEIVISVDSSGKNEPLGSTKAYRFEKIYIDWSATFNCSNEPSRHALVFNIRDIYPIFYPENPEGITWEEFYNQDIRELRIPYDTFCYDVENDLTFIFIEEDVYNQEDQTYIWEELQYFCKPLYDSQLLIDNVLEDMTINSDKDSCSVPCSDVNILLAYTGFDISEKNGLYKKMVYFWSLINKFEDISSNLITKTNCNCRG